MSDDRSTWVDQLLRRCSFPTGPAALAVSGGADSTALAVLAVEAGCEVRIVHVDHRLRDDSAADAEWVRGLGGQLGVPVEVVVAAVEPGPNLEARARDTRHAALPAGALLAHTADDQAETVLLQLMRGAGPRGLAAMDRRRRPLLALRRHDTEEVCRRFGLDPRQDPTNRDPAFRRNRVRYELLPLLADISERDPVPVLVRLAAQQGELAELLDTLGDDVDGSDVAAVRALPDVAARHTLQRWLRTETGDAYGVSAAALDRVLEVVNHESRATEVDGGHRVARRAGRLRVEPPTQPR